MDKKKKLLILGASGMAGHMAYFYLLKTGKYEISNVVFRNKLTDDSIVADLTDKDKLQLLVLEQKPEIILNCVGVLIKQSKNRPDKTILLNSYLPHLLERLALETGSKLIHLSTDCVFSGNKGAYKETDFRDAEDLYGRSKALGEVINDKDLTIRTSIIGPELKKSGEGLFHWFMNQKGVINGYPKAFWSGVSTLELAKAIDAAIEMDIIGLVNLTNGQKISKFDLISLFKEIWNKENIIIKPSNVKVVDKSLLRSKVFKYKVPPFRQMLLDQYEWMVDNKELYRDIYS